MEHLGDKLRIINLFIYGFFFREHYCLVTLPICGTVFRLIVGLHDESAYIFDGSCPSSLSASLISSPVVMLANNPKTQTDRQSEVRIRSGRRVAKNESLNSNPNFCATRCSKKKLNCARMYIYIYVCISTE